MLFLINWYMLIFTDVLQQYRYWLPVYVTGAVLICVFMQHFRPGDGIPEAAALRFSGACGAFEPVWRALAGCEI